MSQSIRYPILLAMMVVLQLGFWWHTHAVRPDLSVVPNVPGKQAVHAMALGDDQAYFRMLGLYLQNSGDYFGQFTSLRMYDFARLYQWFLLLDELDPVSNMIPSLAAYYYSQTQNTDDIRYVVDYLYEHSMRDVGAKWWWLLQSIYLSMHRLNDNDLALKVSAPLVDKRVPVFAQQMAAVVREKRGEMEDALSIMETIAENADQMSEADLLYMTYFVNERIKAIEQGRKDEAQAMIKLRRDAKEKSAQEEQK